MGVAEDGASVGNCEMEDGGLVGTVDGRGRLVGVSPGVFVVGFPVPGISVGLNVSVPVSV